MSMDKKRVVPAGAFKQGCLAMLDEVARKQVEIVVTKRGRPVARLVPIESKVQHEKRVLSQLRAEGRLAAKEADLLAPTMNLAGWKKSR